LYKNKVLKKIYEEKNALKPIKAISGRIPENINDTDTTTNDVFLENMQEYNGEPNITINSKVIL